MEEKKEDDLSIRTALIIVALIAILSFVSYKVMTSSFSDPVSLKTCNSLASSANSGNMTAGVDWLTDECPCTNYKNLVYPNVFASVNFTKTAVCTLQN